MSLHHRRARAITVAAQMADDWCVGRSVRVQSRAHAALRTENLTSCGSRRLLTLRNCSRRRRRAGDARRRAAVRRRRHADDQHLDARPQSRRDDRHAGAAAAGRGAGAARRVRRGRTHACPQQGDDRFTVVAARGGDDIWIEIRRRRPKPAVAPAAEMPQAPLVEMPAPQAAAPIVAGAADRRSRPLPTSSPSRVIVNARARTGDRQRPARAARRRHD